MSNEEIKEAIRQMRELDKLIRKGTKNETEKV